MKRLDQLDVSGNEILVSINKRRVDFVTALVRKENREIISLEKRVKDVC